MTDTVGSSSVHMDVVNSLTGISSSLSLLGSLCIFYSYFKIAGFKNGTKKMLLWLTLADACNALGNLIGTVRAAIKYKDTIDGTQYVGNGSCVDKTDGVCIVQSFITTCASMASFWWTVFIAFHHFQLQRRNQGCLTGPLCGKLYHVFGWFVPLLITIIAVSAKALGEDFSVSSGPWCWIRRCHTKLMSPLMWMTVTGKGWEICAYVITFTLYILMKVSMYRQRRRPQNQRRNEHRNSTLDREIEEFTMLWLFLYFYVTRVWGTIRFIMAAVAYNYGTRDGIIHNDVLNKFDSFLMYVQSFGDSAQAAINCLVFCIFNKNFQQKVCCCIFPSENLESKPLIENIKPSTVTDTSV